MTSAIHAGSAFAPRDERHDALVGVGEVAPGQERRERGRPAGLGHQPELLPEAALRLADRVVGHQHDVLDEPRRRRERDRSRLPGSERVRGVPADVDPDGPSGAQGLGHRRTPVGLDADHADPPLVPGRDPADQPAAADRDQDGLGVRDLLRELGGERALAGDDLGLVERVQDEGAGLGRAGGAGLESLVVVAGDQVDLGALLRDPARLDRRRGLGDEDLGAVAQAPGRVRDGEPEVAPRGRDHAGLRHVRREHLAEGAPRLERSRVLQELELQRQPPGDPERPGLQVHHGRSPDPVADAPPGGLDLAGPDDQRRPAGSSPRASSWHRPACRTPAAALTGLRGPPYRSAPNDRRDRGRRGPDRSLDRRRAPGVVGGVRGRLADRRGRDRGGRARDGRGRRPSGGRRPGRRRGPGAGRRRRSAPRSCTGSPTWSRSASRSSPRSRPATTARCCARCAARSCRGSPGTSASSPTSSPSSASPSR